MELEEAVAIEFGKYLAGFVIGSASTVLALYMSGLICI